MKQLFALSITILLFAGCLTKELPSYTSYSLKPAPQTVTKSANNSNQSIYVTQPKTLNSLNTKHILYTKGLEKNHYALSIWSDEPSRMIQQLLTSKLSSSNYFSYVTSSKMKQTTHYTLYSELINFEHRLESSNAYALLTMRVYLKNNSNSEIISKTLSYKKEVNKNDAKSAVEALNKLTNQFINEVNIFVQNNAH